MRVFTLLFLEALAATTAAELACGVVLRVAGGRLGLGFLKKIPWPAFVFGVICASVLTLPYVWFVLYDAIKDRTTFAVIAELWAWLAEALFYLFLFRMSAARALAFSFILNLFSFLAGLLLFR